MKSYADLFSESPRALLIKLEEDIRGIEARLARLDRTATQGVAGLLAEYERLALLVEQKAYGTPIEQTWHWSPLEGPRIGNMYPAELLGDGRSFSWTGPDPETTFVAVIRRDEPLKLEITFMRTLEPGMQRDMVISVDGTTIHHQITGLQISATIPATSSGAAATRICLSTKNTATPGGTDPRQLGIALFDIRIAPAAKEAVRG